MICIAVVAYGKVMIWDQRRNTAITNIQCWGNFQRSITADVELSVAV